MKLATDLPRIWIVGYTRESRKAQTRTVAMSNAAQGKPSAAGRAKETNSREAILAAAKRIVMAHGYRGLNFREVAIGWFAIQPKPKDTIMPFARIDLAKGKTPEYRATLADVVYQGIVDVLKAPDGDRFVVIGEHSPENLIYDPHFLGWNRSPDFILIQVTSTVGNNKESKLAFFRYIADELKRKLSVRPDDVMINMVFVDRSDWSFGNGEPWA